MLNEYKLISIDLDGTLLEDEDKSISKENKDAIKKCIDNGIKIVISSGRSLESIKMYCDELDIKEGYGSAFHGSTIFKVENIEIVNETFLNDTVAREILNKLKGIENVGLLIFTQKSLYTIDVNNFVDAYSKQVKSLNINIIKDFAIIKEPISKILVKSDRSLLEKIKLDFSPYSDRCKILFSEHNLLEFMSLETNKGYSLEKIAEFNGIKLSETVAIGDNYNDIEMIEKAGLGVAVSNAVDELKAKANYITSNDNNNSAISEVINKFFNF